MAVRDKANEQCRCGVVSLVLETMHADADGRAAASLAVVCMHERTGAARSGMQEASGVRHGMPRVS